MAGGYYPLLPEDVQVKVKDALRNELKNGFDVSYRDNIAEFKYQFEFDPDVENDVEFEGPVWVNYEGKNVKVILEATQTSDSEGEILVKGEGNDHIVESSKSKYHDQNE